MCAMSRDLSVSDSIEIAADAAVLWAQVADPTQMARWSPENTGATTSHPGVLTVGDTFVGANKRGRARWHTRCVVTESEPGRSFAFRVEAIGVRVPRLSAAIAAWSYAFEPTAAGTRVTETWKDGRRGWPDLAASAFDRVVTGGSLFSDFQRRNIARTLARLKADVEAVSDER